MPPSLAIPTPTRYRWSVSRKAVSYAEDTLDVHGVYQRADLLTQAIAVQRGNTVEQRRLKRQYESELTDLEFEIMSDMRGLHADKSIAALERLTKEAIHLHAKARELRGNLASVAGNMDVIEKAVSSMELDHKTLLARMTELGGYFQYLAAVKLDESARRASASPQDTWPPDSALKPPVSAPVIS